MVLIMLYYIYVCAIMLAILMNPFECFLIRVNVIIVVIVINIVINIVVSIYIVVVILVIISIYIIIRDTNLKHLLHCICNSNLNKFVLF
jgi:hypothetical protein